MNGLRFADLSVGQQASFKAAITAEMLAQFASLSGDVNPLHVDRDYATGRGHPERVAHGMLVGSLVSRLVGMELPGRNALLHDVKLAFKRPVYVGDELTLQAEITHLSESHRQVELKVSITNGAGERVVGAVVHAGMYE